ncbi:zinc-binding dehydrogenase [Microbacterium sp. PMB16]|uniref:zinc-binding dehydrogenase n=1 Tax=Microbacterium sp. PMB16 TaxID=3120157 RepID=UPI003F4C4ED1
MTASPPRMPAVRTHGAGDARLEDAAAPHPRPGEVLIEVAFVGLCGSDYALFDGTHPHGGYPRVQGHEFSGTVVTSAPGAPPVGSAVVVDPVQSCGICEACVHGAPNACTSITVLGVQVDGALTSRVAVPAAQVHAVGELPLDVAALVEPLAVGVHTVRRARVSAGDRVVVVGAGPIGLAVTLACVDAGAEVLTIDRRRRRLELALRAGAQHVIDSKIDDVGAAVRAWSGPHSPRAVIDATGSPTAIRLAFDLVAHAGTVGIVGVSPREVRLPIVEFTRKELTVVGSRNSAGDDFPAAIRLLRRHQQEVSGWITARIPLAGVPGALARPKHERRAEVKTLVDVRA